MFFSLKYTAFSNFYFLSFAYVIKNSFYYWLSTRLSSCFYKKKRQIRLISPLKLKDVDGLRLFLRNYTILAFVSSFLLPCYSSTCISANSMPCRMVFLSWIFEYTSNLFIDSSLTSFNASFSMAQILRMSLNIISWSGMIKSIKSSDSS